MIDLEQKRKWDAYAVRKHNRNVRSKAIAEGRAEGRAEGLAKGRAEGLAQGLAEGRTEGHREIANRMKQKGYPIQVITEISGLSEEEIQKL